MEVLVTRTKEATREATCHHAGLRSALEKIMNNVKRSCNDDSHAPSMPVSQMMFLFHSDPGVTRPTNFTRNKTTGKHSIEGRSNRRNRGKRAFSFCITSEMILLTSFAKVAPGRKISSSVTPPQMTSVSKHSISSYWPFLRPCAY